MSIKATQLKFYIKKVFAEIEEFHKIKLEAKVWNLWSVESNLFKRKDTKITTIKKSKI